MLDGLDAKFWLNVANTLVFGLMGIFGWWWRRLAKAQSDINTKIDAVQNEQNQKIKELTKDYDDIEHRVLQVESEVKHLPNRTDIGDIYDVTNKIHGDLQKITGSHESLTRQMEMMNQYLMEKGK